MPIKSAPQYAAISVSTLGDNTLVAAVAGKKIRVLAAALAANAVLNSVRFESGAGGTALTGIMPIVADGNLILPLNGFGWFETAAGALLNLELGNGTLVAGILVYEEIE